jgi:uncharacterized membrane protein YozB (DUF420 family)
MKGFLGTDASFVADFNLVIHVLMFIVLCLGVTAQLRRKFHWHDRFQIPVVVLNILLILFIMLPSFLTIAPDVPANLNNSFFLVPTIHVIVGLLAQGVATYCLLAGLKILPRKIGVLRIWMWVAFVLWTVATLLGIGIYLIWYTSSPSTTGGVVSEHAAEVVGEHAVTEVEEATTQAPAEPVEEHAEELIAEQPTAPPAEPVELVEEHAAEPVEVAAEPAATPTPEPTPTPTPAPVRVGLLTVSDGQIHGDQVTLALTGVTPPPDGSVYEAWLTDAEQQPFSVGKLTVTGDAINHSFTDPQGRNLLGLYSGMFISVEPTNDGDPAPSGTVVYEGAVPAAVMEQVRLAAVTSPNLPNGDSPALRARNQLAKIQDEVGFQKDYSIPNNDLAALKIQAEGIINVIEGKTGSNYGDADGNGEIYDQGDGFGILGHGEGTGYSQAVLNQAIAVSQAQGASAETILRAEQTQTAAKNVISWLEQTRDLELQILKASDTASATDLVNQVVELFNFLNDADGSGLTDPSRAGVQAMYSYAQLMGTIEVFPAPSQPAAPAAEPTSVLIDEHSAESVSEHDGN